MVFFFWGPQGKTWPETADARLRLCCSCGAAASINYVAAIWHTKQHFRVAPFRKNTQQHTHLIKKKPFLRQAPEYWPSMCTFSPTFVPINHNCNSLCMPMATRDSFAFRIRFIILMNTLLMAKTADKRTTNANKHLIN